MITFTFIESRYAPDKDASGPVAIQQLLRHLDYVRAAMRDCFKRGEIPLASHALYTQPGVLDDTVPAERLMGMEAGFTTRLALGMARRAFPADEIIVQTAVYEDLGVSPGMQKGAERSVDDGVPVVYRKIEGWAS